MKLYERSFFVNVIESKLLDEYSSYTPQNQYNNKFISCLYRYLKDNTYTGTHNELYKELKNLSQYSNTLQVNIAADKQTFTIIDDEGINEEVRKNLTNVLKKYSNYKYIVKSENVIQFKVMFGWLPQNASSYLNLLNEETLIDYYIDGITLKPNTHTMFGGAPDSGYVCYKINDIQEYNTVLFLINNALEIEGNLKIASLLGQLKGSKGATLNRIVEFEPTNVYYELGPYNQNYLSATESSLIIQVPYEYSISEQLYVFDVSGSVTINNENNKEDPNDESNFFVKLGDENINTKLLQNLISENVIQSIVNNSSDILDTSISQYLLGNFIWKTADYKLISYLQNLVKTIFSDEQTGIITDGCWSDKLSKYVRKFKQENVATAVFDDDVVDKATEELMLFKFKSLNTGLDPNIYLFKEW